MPRFTVTILRKGQQLKKVFNQESFSVGRSLDCDLALDDLGVSRVQLVVFRKGGQIWIEDKNSSNGTFLNQTRIVQDKPVNVVPTDSIQLGRTSYVLSIDLEVDEEDATQLFPMPVESREAALAQSISLNFAPEPVETKPEEEPEVEPGLVQKEVLNMPFVTTAQELSPEPQMETPPEPEPEPEPEPLPPREEASLQPPVHIPEPIMATATQAEPGSETVVKNLIKDARKQSAQIIYDGEVQAEKRVQNIYRKAQETQEQSEAQAREILLKAQKKADSILQDHQQQGQELIHQARSLAQELREEVEVYVAGLKEKARHEAESLVKEAQQKAQQEAQKISQDSQTEISAKAAEIIEQAEREAHDLVHFAQLQSEEYKASLAEAQAKSESSLQECRRIEEQLTDLQEQYKAKEKQQAELKEEIAKQDQYLLETTKALADLQAEKGEMESRVRLLQQKEADAERSISALNEKNEAALRALEGQKGELEKNLQIQKDKLEKEAVDYGAHLKLELNKKMQKMEEELFRSLVEKRDSLSKEIFSAVEKQVVQITEPAQWTAICNHTHQTIQDVIENKLVSFSQAVTLDEKQVDLKAKKRSEATRWAAVGMALGVLAFFLSGKFYSTITAEQTLVQRKIAAEAQARQEDLAKRQFNPPQVNEVKDTYTDSVIYTRNYSVKYLDPAFQEKLYKASAAYLLKTWRIEEERALQAVSISSALVKELTEKRQSIHPDFINDGIAKMRTLEQQNIARLREVLGTEVRLESFRKFERRFYTENGQ